MIVCLDCGHHNADEAEFCASCGVFLEWEGEPQRRDTARLSTGHDATGPIGPAQDSTPTCPRCGEPDPGDRRWCPRCGAQLYTVAPGRRPGPGRRRTEPIPRRRAPLIVAAIVAALAIIALVLFVGREPAPQVTDDAPVAVVEPTAPPTTAAPQPAMLEVVEATASSTHDRDGGISYDPSVTLDGDPTTAWNDGVRGSPAGEWLEYRFAAPVLIDRIDVVNGYDKTTESGDRFEQNARIRGARLQFERSDVPVTFDDTREPQQVAGPFGPTCRIRLVVDSTYRGTEWQDVALSEIAFLGTPTDGECRAG